MLTMRLKTRRQKFVFITVALVAFGVASLMTATLALVPTTVGEAKAPDPKTFTGAVVQVYGAEVF